MQTAPYLTANALSNRSHYQSSGKISFARFLVWTLLAAIVALTLAGFMYWLFHIGHYFVIIVPIICALAVSGMARLAIAKGHCRNGIVAAFTGVLLGILLYFGSYYIGMVHLWGPDAAARPDILIEYIRLRLATDVVRNVHDSGSDSDRPRRGSSSPGMNWFRFGFESIATVVIVAVASHRRSRKTYCEACQTWLIQDTTPFEPEKAATLVESLQAGSARALAALCATPPYTTIPNTTLAVEYCPSLKEGRTRDCPVYMSLKSVTENPKGATLDTFEQSKGKVLERCVQLQPDELPALAPRFPVFESYAGRAAVASLLPKEEPSELAESSSRHEVFAEIVPLGSDQSGRVLTRKMMWIGNGFAIAGLISFIGGMALLALGASILEKKDNGGDRETIGIVLCTVGGVTGLTAVAGILFDSSFGGNRFLRKKFWSELSRRTGLMVDANDPDALFVEAVPKLNWGKVMLDNASDIGLLVVDRARREIRFEGDRERWRIPAASIESNEVEFYVHGQGAGATKYYYVVLRAKRSQGFWEAPLRERRGSGVLFSKKKKLAFELAAAINEIRGVRSLAQVSV